jgi:hypothetical protein
MAFRQRESEDDGSPVNMRKALENPLNGKIEFRSRKNSSPPPKAEPLKKTIVKTADFLPVIKPRSRSRSPVRQIRRGEQGKSIDEIKKMEKAGFVMSGSRNSRLNLLREQQEAEADRNNVTKRIEQTAKKEELIVNHFRKLLLEKQAKGGDQ